VPGDDTNDQSRVEGFGVGERVSLTVAVFAINPQGDDPTRRAETAGEDGTRFHDKLLAPKTDPTAWITLLESFGSPPAAR
jgi:hypothetical protein